MMRARERILDATAALVERSGFQSVNMVAVAQEAGVSRQTVYAHFGGREELIDETLTRLTTQVTDRIHAQIAERSDARERIVEFIVAVRSEFRQHPVLGAAVFPDGDSPLFDEDLFARAKPFGATLLAPVIMNEPRLTARFDDVLEVMLRFGLSILMFNSDAVRDDDDLRGFLYRVVIPALYTQAE